MTLIKYIIANISNNFNFVLKYIFFLRRIADVTAMSLLSDLPANKEWIKSGVNGLIVTDLNSNFIREAIHFDQDKLGFFFTGR